MPKSPLNIVGTCYVRKIDVFVSSGYGATAHLESGGFIRSRPQVTHPDIQFHFLPSQVIDHGRVASKIEAYQVAVASLFAFCVIDLGAYNLSERLTMLSFLCREKCGVRPCVLQIPQAQRREITWHSLVVL